MTDSKEKAAVRRILEAAGLHVKDLAESSTKRCDLHADDGRDSYLVEVKRLDDDAAVSEATQKGDPFYYRARDRFSSNAVADAVDEAVAQFLDTARELANGLRIVALMTNNSFGADVTNVLGTLYGIRKVAGRKDGADLARDCLYFSHSAFFKHRSELDGAIVLDGSHAQFFLNDYAVRLSCLRESGLARFFQRKRALREQATFESQGLIVADCDADRSDEPAVLRYLERKYSLDCAMRMDSFDYRSLLFLGQKRGHH